jgi:hypothetical protein
MELWVIFLCVAAIGFFAGCGLERLEDWIQRRMEKK